MCPVNWDEVELEATLEYNLAMIATIEVLRDASPEEEKELLQRLWSEFIKGALPALSEHCDDKDVLAKAEFFALYFRCGGDWNKMLEEPERLAAEAREEWRRLNPEAQK